MVTDAERQFASSAKIRLKRRKVMASHIDPVCGHSVDDEDAAGQAEQDGVIYYFDSEECMVKFNLRPEQYTGKMRGTQKQWPRVNV